MRTTPDSTEVDWADLKPRFQAARSEARARGWTFRILTEVEIRNPLLAER
jgi:hypothetical protein